MNKLEIGMYCKTKDGIITKVDYIDNETIYFDKDIFRFYGEGIDFLEKNNLERIIKARFNIINLIEVGDYVNGERIISIIPIDICGNEVLDNQHIFYKDGEIFEKDIKTVVTKEQFESMSYRIGDEIA